MNVDKIAIIGSGPSGLVVLNEFLHTAKDGSSSINSFRTSENKIPVDPAFREIVVFEQNGSIGGTWNYSESTDPAFPADLESYSTPENLRPSLDPPFEKELLHTSVEEPLLRSIAPGVMKSRALWNKSGVYDDLFTNVSDRLMRFSSGYDIDSGADMSANPYAPFITHKDVLNYLGKFADANDLQRHVRLHTSVEKVYKKGNKWTLVVVQLDTANGIEKWYTEQFDAVLIATGRFNIPFIPYVENMDRFIVNHPDCVSHTKAYRNTDAYENKKVLLVGSSISAVDLLQYMIPKCKEVWLSFNSPKVTVQPAREAAPGQWMRDILNDESAGFHRCARIKRFTKDDGVEFEDGQVVHGFDKILFATGYHLFYPFLDIPENRDSNYIRVYSGKKGQSNYALTKADNAYLYTFTVGEPTLCYIGIAHNPLLFLTAEASAIAVAGVWSGGKHLPSLTEQKFWCDQKLECQADGLQMLDEHQFQPFARELYKYAPKNRIDLLQQVHDDEVDESRNILREIFYKISRASV
ncbi:hypothetical protein PICMEDRAFT_74343 [Pichia membranifaciens NRRL Y-2026]|uniref:FAD/NAD(P)-binding domain-containing protein n=1 Tax=Pichia membranifaciens NRRL Y-2026 TaxID=763406 RepID=A0A1E3NGD4_9ASCO|nr:hypothetical protein PICMEDRAFT_74343 [Pichia membranifaciens NRRL Y-2026]ODQ44628.1 hypothetical protein PICMEDRAFT_74343 [Pichia membranifaciens NRRL Y-2026]